MHSGQFSSFFLCKFAALVYTFLSKQRLEFAVMFASSSAMLLIS